MLEKADSKALAAKYGARVRALMGGQSATPKAAPKAAPKPPARPVVPSKPPSSMEACWDALCQARQGVPEKDVQAEWFGLVERVHPGKAQESLTPADWGLVLAAMAVPIDEGPLNF